MSLNRRLLLGATGALTLSACSTQQMINVALSRSPEAAVKNLAQSRVNAYTYNPQLALADLRRIKNEYDKLMGNLQKESSQEWGKRESGTLPSRTRYVKYTENYKNRVVVDYDAGTILIEHLEDEQVKDKLRRATVVALLTPGDPGAVDLFSDKEIELTGQPYLQELVVDENNAVIKTREDVERYAAWLVDNRLQQRSIDANGRPRTVYSVQMKMINTFIDKRALQYASLVRENAEKTGVSRSLIYTIIRIESAFNPYAVSSAPAYGLMQLVPTSGGREAYRKARGEDVIPTKEFLFAPENNIEFGTAYLGVLLFDSPLREIRDPLSREYCAIAAYNTGPSNVYRAFSSKSGRARQDEALDAVNTLRPDDVYAALRSRLPYAETRGYIANAVQTKKRYAMM
ncbi:MAG: murein transglycosylase domain-containing protein [Hylemonella sp.]|uniref:murein transglycosylase domain-containing protein n=1 Tax=Hylemonella sp. TaxID=2066020 RepID=UPI0022C392A0|nr:murein transglycosylase domain-containing protein [Hylemonella sp.]MCZ8252049.1 murein transglycosylase domain-containing protein [Hylemonella sp.]